ncbi:hypothetical protein CVT24_001766 [Panaeolus cyanescens]|uniref:Uncharacterized protein n=1 Tax=Panaeolus cyanescens TaxID=181874 RepID=A0A409YU85_9AGAR|nr:hypothetical protein CVT24_001766 [Panaeolus cyanescens]
MSQCKGAITGSAPPGAMPLPFKKGSAQRTRTSKCLTLTSQPIKTELMDTFNTGATGTPPPSETLKASSREVVRKRQADRVHAESLARKEERRVDRARNGTEKSYPRHVKNYIDWWEMDQTRQREEWDRQQLAIIQAKKTAHQEDNLPESDMDLRPEPFIYESPHPITAIKACLFLNYELKRNKRTAGGKKAIPNTTVGVSSIKQTINSLESYRLEHSQDPEYLADPESQIKLRNNVYIQNIEKSAQLSEAKRQEESQEMKSKGIVSATFSTDHLVLMSKDYLLNPQGNKRINIVVPLRNRTMLLFSTSMAFRGDNTRRIKLSDLNVEEVPMPGIDLDCRIKVFNYVTM